MHPDDAPSESFAERLIREHEAALTVGTRVRAKPSSECVNEWGVPRHRQIHAGHTGRIIKILTGPWVGSDCYLFKSDKEGYQSLSAAELVPITHEEILADSMRRATKMSEPDVF